MQSPDFEALLAVNDQIATLARLGVRLDLELGNSREHVHQQLQQINADVARRISQGFTLESTLEEMQGGDLRRYAGTMRYALAARDWSAALERSRAIARASSNAWWSIWSGMSYPLLVCVLAYVGLVAFCLCLVPALRAIYSELRLPMGTWIGVMAWLSSNLWWWAWIPPLAFAAVVIWLLRQAPARIAAGSTLQWNRRAKLADVLGDLVNNQVSRQQALSMAEAATVADGSAAHRPRHARAMRDNAAPHDDLPPLLRWMMAQSDQRPRPGEMFHAASEAYRSLASRKADQRDRRAMLIPCVLVGGVAALLYGLALFLPLVELLLTLATESASTPIN